MAANTTKSLKTLSFDENIEEQHIAFVFLEKIRYKQTRFITRLVMDFIKNNEIDISGDYNEIVKTCQEYIASNPTDDTANKPTEDSDSIKEVLQFLKKIDGKLDNINQVEKEIKTAQLGLSGKKDVIERTGSSETYTEDIDSGNNLGGMLSSFQMMAEI